MSKSTIIIIFMAIVIIGGGVAGILLTANTDPVDNFPTANTADSSLNEQTEEVPAASSSELAEYSEAAVTARDDDVNVLFFTAPWCPNCRSVERNLEAGQIPEDITILKVDYDTETELKQKYGITYQTSFVQIDNDGNLITKWQGFAQDDIDVILEKIERS